MVQAELERNITKEIDEKPAQKHQKISLISQLSDTVGVLDSVIAELRSSQNGDMQENAIASELISSLTEIRGKTLKQNPVIVWQNSRILLRGGSVIKEPEISSIKTEQPAVREAKIRIAKPEPGSAQRTRAFTEPKPNGAKVTKSEKKPEIKPPEGFMSIAQICKTLGISGSRWYVLKAGNKLVSYKIGGGVFYKKEDVDKIAAERHQKATRRIDSRLNRKPAFKKETDGEFEETMEDMQFDESFALDLFKLHLSEIGKIPMEIKKHWRWNAKIFISQMAAYTLPEILESGNLAPQQKKQISAVLENNVVKAILEPFQGRLSNILSKRVLDNVVQKISKRQKLDNVDEFFINSVQNLANWIIDKLSGINRIRSPDKKESELQKLIDRQIYLINEGVNARNKLTEANQRLVVSIAKKYTGRGLDIHDLEGYGVEGLMRATVKFDWRAGYQFSTYATWWIRQSITRALADYSRLIRLPPHMHEKLGKLNRMRWKQMQETGEDIDLEKIVDAQETGETAYGLKKAIRVDNLTSLNLPVGEQKGGVVTELGDFFEDKGPTVDEQVDLYALRAQMREVLDTLNYRERRVLELRFGVLDGRSRKLEEVAQEFQVTRERIRQIEAQGLNKLRHPSRARKLRPYLDDDPKSIQINPGQAANVPRTYKKK